MPICAKDVNPFFGENNVIFNQNYIHGDLSPFFRIFWLLSDFCHSNVQVKGKINAYLCKLSSGLPFKVS